MLVVVVVVVDVVVVGLPDCRALKTLSRPPVTVLPASAGIGSTEFMRMLLSWAVVRDGF